MSFSASRISLRLFFAHSGNVIFFFPQILREFLAEFCGVLPARLFRLLLRGVPRSQTVIVITMLWKFFKSKVLPNKFFVFA